MSRNVVISTLASKKLENLFDYLIKEWSVISKNNFVIKLDKSIDSIKKQPYGFPLSKKGNDLRKCVITKQTTLYYRFNYTTITIVTFFDTRQHPNKLKKHT